MPKHRKRRSRRLQPKEARQLQKAAVRMGAQSSDVRAIIAALAPGERTAVLARLAGR